MLVSFSFEICGQSYDGIPAGTKKWDRRWLKVMLGGGLGRMEGWMAGDKGVRS
ncbi:hypothetical protein [Bacteroides helcogenes]|uniref:hypothetical protein n=1 Tax=Bacteroides helcogenes TaxID=290053 RepID=UPI0002FFF5C4|nr:hypothetical protein [Bacteroides helcogenes]MDY5239531.1 hypothetical protein [Bacteroides helcogenes]